MPPRQTLAWSPPNKRHRGEFIYLASPYSHPDPKVRQVRHELVCGKAAELMLEGYVVFCPIAHTAPIEQYGPPEILKKDGDFWLRQDFAILDMCDAVVVYKLPGWDKSYGVKEEVSRAQRQGQPVRYVEDDTNG